MSSVVDSHARTYPWPGFKKELPKKQDQVFSLKLSESYAWYDPNSLSWKTWQRSLITDWTSYSGSFQKQGMMRNGQLYHAKIWEAVIEDNVGGALPTPRANSAMAMNLNQPSIKNHQNPNLETVISNLPTPTASDVEGGVAKDVQFQNGSFFRENKQGVRWGVKLRDAVQALPTPTAREWKDGSWKSCKNCKFHHTLGRQIHIAVRSLPTPTTMDHLPQRSVESMKKQATEHRKGRKQLANLREAVNPQAVDLFNQFQTLPTPTAHEHKATGQKNTSQSGQMLSSIARRGELSEETGLDMFLNPAFVEEMMGYEVGWTDLNR